MFRSLCKTYTFPPGGGKFYQHPDPGGGYPQSLVAENFVNVPRSVQNLHAPTEWGEVFNTRARELFLRSQVAEKYVNVPRSVLNLHAPAAGSFQRSILQSSVAENFVNVPRSVQNLHAAAGRREVFNIWLRDLFPRSRAASRESFQFSRAPCKKQPAGRVAAPPEQKKSGRVPGNTSAMPDGTRGAQI